MRLADRVVHMCQFPTSSLLFDGKTYHHSVSLDNIEAAQNVKLMARKRRSDSNSTPASPMTIPRRRSTLRELQATTTAGDVDTITPKIIDARLPLEKAQMFGIDDPRPVSSRFMALAGRIFIETIPQWLAVGAMLGLIFGGCCSNVSFSGRIW